MRYNRDCSNPPPSGLRPPAVNSSSKTSYLHLSSWPSTHRDEYRPFLLDYLPKRAVASASGYFPSDHANRRSPRPGLHVPDYLTPHLRCLLAQPASSVHCRAARILVGYSFVTVWQFAEKSFRDTPSEQITKGLLSRPGGTLGSGGPFRFEKAPPDG